MLSIRPAPALQDLSTTLSSGKSNKKIWRRRVDGVWGVTRCYRRGLCFEGLTCSGSEPQITAASAQPVYGIIHTSDIEGADISGRTVGSTSRSRAVSNTSLGKRYRSGCTASSLEIDHPQFASDEAFQESGEDGPNKRRKTECCCSPSSSVPHSWARRQWRCSTKTFRLRSLPVLENLVSLLPPQ